MMWLFFLAVSSVVAIQLPEVIVETKLREKYGVTDDVNKPGYFDDALAKFKIHSSKIPGMNFESAFKLIENTVMYTFPVHLSRQIIMLSSAVQGQNLMQATAAHLLNVVHRFQQSATTANLVVYGQYKKVLESSNATVIHVCRKDRHLLEMAHSSMKDFNPVSACDNFLESIRRDPSILTKKMEASLAAHKSLEEVEKMINDGDLYTFNQIKEHMEKNPVVDPSVYEYFVELLKENLKDYAAAVEELSRDKSIRSALEAVTKKLSFLLQDKFNFE